MIPALLTTTSMRPNRSRVTSIKRSTSSRFRHQPEPLVLLAVPADAGKREDVDRLIEVTRERFGRIDVVVNNAGITRDQLLVRMKDDDWDQVLDTNLRGVFLMTRAAGKVMMRQKSRRIISIASTAGAMGNAGQVNYSAAKAGVIGLTKAAARDWRTGISW